MSFTSFVVRRYITSNKQESFLRVMLLISFFAVLLGNAVLVSVVSIMNGFQSEIKELLIKNKPHIYLAVPSDFTTTAQEILRQMSLESTKGLQIPVLITSAVGSSGALAYANENFKELGLAEISVSRQLASDLGLQIGDSIKVYFPATTLTPLGSIPRSKVFTIANIYFEPRDFEQQVKISFEQAKQIINPQYINLEIRLDNPMVASTVKEKIKSAFIAKGIPLSVTTWIEINEPLWNALQLEKTAYFIVLSLIILVASFSILSTLVMFVFEKRKELAIFVALGASYNVLKRIFIRLGLLIGLSGTISGLVCGFLICLALKTYGFPLDERVFGISQLPVQFSLFNYFIVGLVSLIICFLAVLYPVKRLSELKSSLILRD